MSDKPEPKKPIHPPPSVQATAMNSLNLSVGPRPFAAGRTLPIGSMLGKYKIAAVLGHGGMGNVYAAEDPLIKRRVAIKVLPPELARDQALVERLLSEARAAAKLNHPHVVTVYDVDQSEGMYYIVMELVSAGSVQDYLAQKGSPGWRAATRIVGEACKALVAAHEAGLIHRDIKPSNLMLTPDGRVKVADFGLAKLEASDATMHTQPGVILGTPAFMSPEQCRGDKVDHRTDIYSLGCTYYALLTGKPPFEAASSIQMMFAHCSAPIPDPRALKNDVPDSCMEILRKSLAKDANDRYPSARAMFNDIRAVLGGATITSGGSVSAIAALVDDAAQAAPVAQPKPAPAKPVWQRPLALAGAAAIIMLLLIAGIVLATRSGGSAAPPVAGDETKPVTAAAAGPATALTGAALAGMTPVVNPQRVATVEQTGAVAPKIVPAPFAVPVSTSAGISPATSQPAFTLNLPLPPKPPLPNPELVASAVVPVPQPRPAVPTAPAKPELPANIINSLGEKLVLIQPGKFIMGDAALPDAPPHQVTLTKAFYMGEIEVLQSDFVKVMGAGVRDRRGPDELSASFVNWEMANLYCKRLSALSEEKAAGRVYRLPTEAEWEYACRAGTTTKYSVGDTLTTNDANFGKKITLVARRPRPAGQMRPVPPGGAGMGPRRNGPAQNGDSSDATDPPDAPDQQGQDGAPPDDNNEHPLERPGFYPANAWGLFDMHGGVWEWCADFYSINGYKVGSPIDPKGPRFGTVHVSRGGCWSSTAEQCASAYRNNKIEGLFRAPSFGFRIVCDSPKQPG
jgi:formylglycine-generating enzyme required for sulfatase activity/tRNA A-37 threonylcarbamoyl transferase component Bud32